MTVVCLPIEPRHCARILRVYGPGEFMSSVAQATALLTVLVLDR